MCISRWDWAREGWEDENDWGYQIAMDTEPSNDSCWKANWWQGCVCCMLVSFWNLPLVLSFGNLCEHMWGLVPTQGPESTLVLLSRRFCLSVCWSGVLQQISYRHHHSAHSWGLWKQDAPGFASVSWTCHDSLLLNDFVLRLAFSSCCLNIVYNTSWRQNAKQLRLTEPEEKPNGLCNSCCYYKKQLKCHLTADARVNMLNSYAKHLLQNWKDRQFDSALHAQACQTRLAMLAGADVSAMSHAEPWLKILLLFLFLYFNRLFSQMFNWAEKKMLFRYCWCGQTGWTKPSTGCRDKCKHQRLSRSYCALVVTWWWCGSTSCFFTSVFLTPTLSRKLIWLPASVEVLICSCLRSQFWPSQGYKQSLWSTGTCLEWMLRLLWWEITKELLHCSRQHLCLQQEPIAPQVVCELSWFAWMYLPQWPFCFPSRVTHMAP